MKRIKSENAVFPDKHIHMEVWRCVGERGEDF